MKTKIIAIAVFVAITLFAFVLHASVFSSRGIQQSHFRTNDTLSLSTDSMPIPPPRHQTYKGVEIDGTHKDLAEKIGLKERHSTKTVNSEYLYTGTFAGYKTQNSILVTPLTETPYAVITYIEQRAGFEDAYSDFKLFLSNMTAVYGNPYARKEEFKNPYSRGDGYSIKALNEGKADFMAAWKTELGLILIKVMPTTVGGACLMISYTDNINEDKNQQEKTQIIRRDL